MGKEGRDTDLERRIYRGISVRLLGIGAFAAMSLALPRAHPHTWWMLGAALGCFAALAVVLLQMAKGPVSLHYDMRFVFLNYTLAYATIGLAYLERGDPNSVLVLLFVAPLMFEAIARRGMPYVLVAPAMALATYVVTSARLGTPLSHLWGDGLTFLTINGVIYVVAGYLVREVRDANDRSKALAHTASVVATAMSTAEAFRDSYADLLTLTGALDVALDDQANPKHTSEVGRSTRTTVVDGTIILGQSGHRMIFDRAQDHAYLEPIGYLFDLCERREALVGELQWQSATDPLTGLANRRSLDQMDRWAAAADGWPVTVVMVDLDCFKAFNDNFGHMAGDRLLVDFAQALRTGVRSVDQVLRYGGEEFSIVVRGELTTASLVVERIRLSWAEIRNDVTFSAGIARVRAEETVAAALERADRALYAAKEGGRNQTCLAPSHDAASSSTSTVSGP